MLKISTLHTRNAVKAIIFDIGGVLIENPWPKMVGHYAKHLGVEEARFLQVYKEIQQEWQSGHIEEPLFWQKMCQKLQVSLPTSENLWVEGFASAYQEKDHTFALIRKLKKLGLKLAILSNTEAPVMNFLIEKKYPDFHVFVYSCGEGHVKPNKEIFLLTLEKLDVRANQTLFIDDLPENVEGAKKLGMQGILFESAEQLERELFSFL